VVVPRDRAQIRDEGSAQTVRRLAAGALAALLLLLGALVGVAVFATDRLQTTAEERFVREAFPLRVAARDLVLELLNEETGVRGYVITGDPASLGPYRRGRANAARDLRDLGAHAKRRPGLANALADVEVAVRSVDRYFAGQIALVRSGPAGRRQAQENVGAGKAPFDRFRMAARRLERHIDELVRSAQAQQRSTFRRTLAFLLAAGLAAGAIALGLLLSVPARLDRLYRREQEARRAAERGAQASRALAHVREAVVLADADDVVRYWNAAAEDVFDLPEERALGRTVATVVPELADPGADGGAALVPIGGAGAGERWLAVTTTRFPEGRVVVLRDVTDEHALERIRNDFVATAAHELRTPIASVFGAARTLRRRDVALPPETSERLLAMIESESDRLGRIVEQILTSAALDAGELTLEPVPCDVRAVCARVLRSVEVWRPSNVSVSLVAEGAVTPFLCDEERLHQVLLNLTENAVKYSPDGGRVELRLLERPGGVRIDVSDEGMGIPASERERVFEKFYRLDPSMSRGVGGSGLGLYITRRLLDQMGASVTVDANPGGGTIVTIELPRS
jgi:signal transduction histidine kinase